MFSCGNEAEQKKEDISDSSNKVTERLEKPATIPLINTAAVYDSLRKKLVGTDEYPQVTQMRVAFQDFYAYNNDLQIEFYIFCGDKKGSSIPAGRAGQAGFTTKFFTELGNADELYDRMQKVLESLPPRLTPEEDMRGLINTLRPSDEPEDLEGIFLNAYFKDVPPTAAITILRSFDTKLERIESDVLRKYAEKYGIPVQKGAGIVNQQ